MTKPYPTPHIAATPEDFAKTVLMPGDPLRAKFIAENFLENAILVNNVRGIQGYTGTYGIEGRIYRSLLEDLEESVEFLENVL